VYDGPRGSRYVRAPQPLLILKIASSELKAAATLEDLQSSSLEVRIVVVVQVIEPEHIDAQVQKTLRNVKANESGGARDEHRSEFSRNRGHVDSKGTSRPNLKE
jgi:hypothetical protein